MSPELDIFHYTDYRVALRDFYERTRQRNHGWSHTIWARRLGVKSASTLSMILNGQRHPSSKLAHTLAQSLGLQARHLEYFSLLVELQKKKDAPELSALLMEKLSKFRSDRKFHYLDLDQFSFMSHWYYSAIREMVKLRGFREDAHWIAGRLKFKVSVHDVREAIRTLLRLRLLERDTTGRLIPAGGVIDTPTDTPNEALKRFHEETLANARESVRTQSIEERDLYSSIFVTDRSRLPQAKKLIRKFHDELCDLLETEEGDSVFQLEVALFPIAQSKGELK